MTLCARLRFSAAIIRAPRRLGGSPIAPAGLSCPGWGWPATSTGSLRADGAPATSTGSPRADGALHPFCWHLASRGEVRCQQLSGAAAARTLSLSLSTSEAAGLAESPKDEAG